MKFNYFFLFAFVLLFASCSEKQETNTIAITNLESQPLKYAQRFSICKSDIGTFVFLFGNKELKDTTATYIILRDSTINYTANKNEVVIKKPIQKIASLSSLYSCMIENLNAHEKIIAVENIDYYNSEKIITKFNKGEITQLSVGPKINVEQTITLKPDILFNFGMPGEVATEYEKLNAAGIVTAICLDHLEKEPLARAEWIKFFAAFLNKETEANELFLRIEANYFQLKKIAQDAKSNPTVFTELKYGDVWYEPGGKSFMAQLIKDANANYLWQTDTNTGSLPLSFENVLKTAKNAEYWLNLSAIKSKEELLKSDNRYKIFKAFQQNKCFNNTLVTNTKGYSTYWESGILFPNKLLSDLIQIFHPELKDSINAPFYYYKQLQ